MGNTKQMCKTTNQPTMENGPPKRHVRPPPLAMARRTSVLSFDTQSLMDFVDDQPQISPSWEHQLMATATLPSPPALPSPSTHSSQDIPRLTRMGSGHSVASLPWALVVDPKSSALADSNHRPTLTRTTTTAPVARPAKSKTPRRHVAPFSGSERRNSVGHPEMRRVNSSFSMLSFGDLLQQGDEVLGATPESPVEESSDGLIAACSRGEMQCSGEIECTDMQLATSADPGGTWTLDLPQDTTKSWTLDEALSTPLDMAFSDEEGVRANLDALAYNSMGFGCFPRDQSQWDQGRYAAVVGPFGPYNPPPAYMRDIQQQTVTPMSTPASTPEIVGVPHDVYENKQVIMVAGKHKGKLAFVQRKVNKKYRVQVEGVPYGLEFFPKSFELLEA